MSLVGLADKALASEAEGLGIDSREDCFSCYYFLYGKKGVISLKCQLFSIPHFFSISLSLFHTQTIALEKPGLTFRSSTRKITADKTIQK